MASIERRIVCHFSCGAASAVATKLAIMENNRRANLPLVILNEKIDQEHSDNARFLADCQAWFGQEVISIQHPRYGGDIYAAFEGEKYIAGVRGARCTLELKKKLAAKFWQPGDIDVLGYTAEEQDRYDNWIDSNNERRGKPILIDRGLTKADCLAMVERAGIALPVMYELGYEHNNCIGCVKGGMGYWNKIRVDFPLQFQKMSDYSRAKNVKLLKRGDERIFLDELLPTEGNYQVEPEIQCGIFCEMAERELTKEAP
jgi:hypothetical protein